MAYQKLTPIIATGATAPRYLGDRFADIVNLRDFGAVGDGETDDSAAWAAWQTALQSGKMGFIPAGDYLVNSSVVSFPNGRFYGDVTKCGGFSLWNGDWDYDVSSVVTGSNNWFYIAKTASGPNTAAGAQNPINDNGTYWEKLGGEDFFVTKTGSQEIDGEMKLTGTLTIEDRYPGIDFRHTSATKGDQTTKYCDINFYDNEPDVWGIIRCSGGADTGSISLRAYKWVYNSGSNIELVVAYNSDGVEVVRTTEDNKVLLGSAGRRWKQVYAGTSSINTSDEREKASISSIPDEVLDAWGSVGFVQFQFRDAVAEKGEKARLHSGLIAQRIDAIFKAAGLDASKYGLFCYDSWEAEPEILDANGNIDTPAFASGDRFSLRYEEALCMEAAYQRRRADRLEARIALLEERVNQLTNNGNN